MKILITGGAGFIASHVADAYLEIGHEVVIVDNLSTGEKKNLNPKAKFIKADITDKKKIQEIIRKERPDVINHHAAHIQVGYSVKNPQFDAENNIIGLLNIMEAAKEIPIKKVIMAATGGAMYGNKVTPFNEEMKAEPLSPYGISKRAGELYLNYYHELYQIPFISLRYSNVYGPRQNAHGESGVIAIFAEMMAEGKAPVINGDGTHTRDYVYVEDVARANVLALNSDFVGELNIGTETEISTNEVFRKVATEMGAEIEEKHSAERPGEQVTSSLNYSKAKEVLGWEPRVNFDEGVRRVVAWYKNR
ncbi:MAG: UDP-glucose 4-epimerase [Candidatus Pacebacteria bacterium GW2011_GWF2_38_9]|nr:MAG: UDP-glucose 4-epimerase, UDP-glucose 4-epimerase [candidate division TM6 bacterium GW2011_GWF2_28_16]KKQ09335.1 MAG: UDP-glucose 4-epimerase [Candidatus Pacebacteria bacterium GW2011_GWF1_36_5]KKQ88841.1 MAG: UDP-glucose 4-epimerase [Candidatus Pacebacteria bacterium GW2011_GWF2_38_9]HAZ73220.1 UDP-glucose 4-epimerase [Candidatus Paceibacterota bacterium]